MSAVSSCPSATRRSGEVGEVLLSGREARARAHANERRLESVARRLRAARIRPCRGRQQRALGDCRGLRPVGEPSSPTAAEERMKRVLVVIAAAAFVAAPSAVAAPPTIDARVDQATSALRRLVRATSSRRRSTARSSTAPASRVTSHRSRGSDRRSRSDRRERRRAHHGDGNDRVPLRRLPRGARGSHRPARAPRLGGRRGCHRPSSG